MSATARPTYCQGPRLHLRLYRFFVPQYRLVNGCANCYVLRSSHLARLFKILKFRCQTHWRACFKRKGRSFDFVDYVTALLLAFAEYPSFGVCYFEFESIFDRDECLCLLLAAHVCSKFVILVLCKLAKIIPDKCGWQWYSSV